MSKTIDLDGIPAVKSRWAGSLEEATNERLRTGHTFPTELPDDMYVVVEEAGGLALVAMALDNGSPSDKHRYVVRSRDLPDLERHQSGRM